MPSIKKMPSLQGMCLDQVSRLLNKGTWNECVENPFSSMPAEIIDTLMDFLLTRPIFNSKRDMRLLFQSGQLSRLELSTLLVDDDRELLLKWLTEETCKNLRNLDVLYPLGGEKGGRVVGEILQRCHYLEEFHSKQVIDLNDLRNCPQLKKLRLHLFMPPDKVVCKEYFQTVIDFVQSKPHLEVFCFCNIRDDAKVAYKAIAASLEECPNLVSVGLIDSLEALFTIRETRRTIMKLKLKKCVWGANEDEITSSKFIKPLDYRNKFPDMVQNAVHMCPEVETLVINVHNEGALEHLIHLRDLRSLSIKFVDSVADRVKALIFLLRRIGPSLDHLSVDVGAEIKIPAEAIRDHCLNLKTFQIYGKLSTKDDMENCLSHLKLERVHIWKANSKSLLFLLRNSPNLKELYLGNVLCLDQELVGKILMNDFMFPRLTVVGIKECLLSTAAVTKLLNGAVNLKELFFGSKKTHDLAHISIAREKPKLLHYYDNFTIHKREFYLSRPHPCDF